MDGSSRPRAPQPAPPDRAFSFTDWQTNNPTAPPPGDKIDAELDRTNQAVEDVIEWVSTSLNSDGSLVEPPGTDPPPPSGDTALASDYAAVAQAWAEHMPDTIPPNILAEMAITGEHWSARWWAKQAQQYRGATVSESALPDPQPGQLWFDSVSCQLFVWYVDPTSAQWVITNAGASPSLSWGTTSFGAQFFPTTIPCLENAGQLHQNNVLYLERSTSTALDGPMLYSHGTVSNSWIGPDKQVQSNARFDADDVSGANAWQYWNVLSTLHVNTMDPEALTNLSGANGGRVSVYGQAWRETVSGYTATTPGQRNPAIPAGVFGISMEAAVIECRSLTGLPSAQDGLLRSLELDLYCDGADDIVWRGNTGGRAAVSVVIGSQLNVPTEVSRGISVTADTSYVTVHRVFNALARYSESILDCRNSIPAPGSGANAIWMSTGQSIAFDGGALTQLLARLSIDGTVLQSTGEFVVGDYTTQTELVFRPGTTTATAAQISTSNASGLIVGTDAIQLGFNSATPIARPTGWGTSTGGMRAAITASSTLPQVAAGLAQLLSDLTAYGLIGT
jgi:hypothetical protein